MIENKNEEATSEWIEWAMIKVDWYDLTIAYDDKFLGKRDHSKNKEDKDFENRPFRYNWFY